MWVLCADVFATGVNDIIQSLVHQYLCPVSTTLPLYVTMHFTFVNRDSSHPTLHSITTDIKEWDTNPSMMCLNHAFSGSSDIGPFSCLDKMALICG